MKRAIIGLILKDYFLFKQYGLRFVFFIIIFYLAIPFLFPEDGFSDNSALAGILCILFSVLPITTFSYDENAKWDRYALSMPITREMLVLSKYLYCGLMIIGGGIATFLYMFLIGFFRYPEFLAQTLPSCLTYMGISILFISIMLPFIFRFGAEKGRIAFMIAGVIFGIIGSSMYTIAFQNISFSFLIILLFLAVVVYLSYLISLKVYRRQEIN